MTNVDSRLSLSFHPTTTYFGENKLAIRRNNVRSEIELGGVTSAVMTSE